jgi:tetratricopeptide (TPR) repeat protein
MFKRFPSPRALAPFPPIEEEIRCPQCGFNHAGWAFEPGYAKLCVKCGTVLEAPEESEDQLEQGGEGRGLLDRLLKGVFGRKAESPEQRLPCDAPVEKGPHLEAGNTRRPEEASAEAGQEAPKPGHIEEEAEHEAEQMRGEEETPSPPDRPHDLEAARVGDCKRQGRLLAAQGRFEEAAAMLEKVVGFEPNDVDAWAELGRIHYTGSGNLTRSIHCSRKALEIDGDLVSVKCTLCLALLFDGQFDLAKKGFLEIIRSVRKSRNSDEAFQENCKALLQDCLGELYASKKRSSGELLARIREIIELLEIEKIYFH